jgi:hypothetical protein
MEVTIIKELVAAFIAALVMYIGFINKMRSQIAVLDALEPEDETPTPEIEE